VAQALPPSQRAVVLEMAQEWERLADQQDHATDLQRHERDG
jgi:hypothetical protein